MTASTERALFISVSLHMSDGRTQRNISTSAPSAIVRQTIVLETYIVMKSACACFSQLFLFRQAQRQPEVQVKAPASVPKQAKRGTRGYKPRRRISRCGHSVDVPMPDGYRANNHVLRCDVRGSILSSFRVPGSRVYWKSQGSTIRSGEDGKSIPSWESRRTCATFYPYQMSPPLPYKQTPTPRP